MNSPFPGMDPYLEQHWLDIHHSLVTYARDQIQVSLPRDLLARVEERVCVEADDGPTRNIHPDVRVVEHPAPLNARESGGVAVVEEVEAPALIELDDEPITEGFIKITDTTSGKVVTVIEVLSLTNKLPGEGQQLYRQKQKELNAAGTSLTDYTIEPDPPLDPATAAWANELLKSKGLR